jgi:hypothetical protein
MSAFGNRMTMRAEVLRNTASKDVLGGPGKPGWTLVKDSVPCYVWSRVRQRVVGQKNVEVEEMGVLFRAGTDVLALDRIQDIKDRRGRVLFAGPFEVLTGTEKSDGDGVDHLAFKLRRAL